MKLSFMKFADKYAGWAACAVLSVLAGAASFAGLEKKPFSGPPRRILVMKFWGLGSIILATPLVKALKSAFPSAEIVFFTLRRNKPAAESTGLFDAVLSVDVDSGILRFASTLIAALTAARRMKFDIAADLEFFTRFSAVVTYLAGAPVRAGYHSFSVWRGNLHNVKVPFNRYWHVTRNFLNLGAALGAPSEGPVVCAAPLFSSADTDAVRKLLAVSGAGHSDRIAAMHANASDLALERRWPYENFAALADGIALEWPDVRIVFVGTAAESDSVEKIKSLASAGAASRIINLAGRLDIKELAALFSLSAFAVCNDSGPLHLAWTSGVKTVSLFGPETPVIYGPLGEGHAVFFKNMDCSPCVNVHDGKSVKCSRGSPECLEKITPDEVLAAIKDKKWL